MQDSDSDSQEAQLAGLLQLVASGRPEQLAHVALSQLPEVARAELSGITDAFAALGLAAGAIQPSGGLRGRILASAKARLAQRPRRALLVLDMLNDHLEEGGPLEVPRARSIVPALKEALERARAEGTPVVYVLDEHDPDDPDLDVWRAHNVRGSRGAEVWSALAPSPADRIVRKPTYSGFTDSTLGAVLDELGVDTLVLTGCLMEMGLHATAVDAMQRGYAVEIPPATQAGVSEATEHVALTVLGVMQPYGAARRERLARLMAGASERAPER